MKEYKYIVMEKLCGKEIGLYVVSSLGGVRTVCFYFFKIYNIVSLQGDRDIRRK